MCLATAHPAKFEVTSRDPHSGAPLVELPAQLAGLREKSTRAIDVLNRVSLIRAVIDGSVLPENAERREAHVESRPQRIIAAEEEDHSSQQLLSPCSSGAREDIEPRPRGLGSLLLAMALSAGAAAVVVRLLQGNQGLR